MAKKTYAERLAEVKASSKLSSKSTSATLQNQIDNYKTRLTASGVDPTKATDTRNPLEKMLNLRQDQNAIFDVFELINRPQQALFNTIDAAQTGKDKSDAFIAGLSGDQTTSGGKLFRNTGIGNDDKVTWNPGTWKNSIDDILGFGADVLLDPADLIPINTVGKVSKLVGKNSRAIKTIGDSLEELSKSNKLVSIAGDVLPTKADDLVQALAKGKVGMLDEAGNVVDAAKKLNISDSVLKTIETGKDTTTLTDAVFKGGVAGGKKVLKTGDNAFSSILSKMDNKALENSGKATKKAAVYEDTKTALKSIFNSNNRISKRALKKFAQDKGISQIATDELMGLNKTLDNQLSAAVESTGLERKTINKEITKYLSQKQANLFPTKTIDNIIAEQSSDLAQNLSIPTIYKTVDGTSIKEMFKKTIGNEKLYKDYITESDGYLHLTDDGLAYLKKISEDPLKSDFFTATYNNIGTSENLNKLADDIRSKIETKGYKPNSFDNLILKQEVDLADNADLLSKHPEIKAIADENYFAKAKKIVDDDTGLKLQKKNGEVYSDVDYMHRSQSDELQKYRKLINETKPSSMLNIKDPSLKKVAGESTSRFMNVGFYNDIGADLVKRVPASEMSRGLREAITNGKLQEEFSSNVLDFAHNYRADSVNAKILNDMLVTPLKEDSQVLYKVMDERNALDKTRYKLDQAVQRLDAGEPLDNLLNGIDIKDTSRDNLATMLDDATAKVAEFDTKEAPTLFKDSIIIPDRVMNKTSTFAKSTPGYTRVDIKTLQTKINRLLSYDGSGLDKKTIEKISSQFNSGKYYSEAAYLDSRVANMINLVDADSASEMFGSIMNVIDSVNSLFKMGKLLSPAYNARNVTGGALNMMIAGVPPSKIWSTYKYGIITSKNAKKAIELIKNGTPIEKLPDNLGEAYQTYRRFLEYGFGEQTATKLYGLEKVTAEQNTTTLPGILGKGEQGVKAVNKANANMNSFMDNASRLGIMKYFDDNPQKLYDLGVDNAGDAIRKIAFDPDDLSTTESNVMRKIIPFYTFTKKNLAFQLDNLPNNVTKYYKLQKAVDSTWTANGVDKKDLQEYQRNGTIIPLPLIGGDDIAYFKLNLPSSDVYEWLSNPVERGVSSTSPIIKYGYEKATGKNVFTGRDIEDYKGQKATNSFSDLPFNLGTKKNEWLAGQIGLDTPIRSVMGAVNLATSSDKKAAFGDFLGITGSKNVDSFALNNQYKELNALQDYIKLSSANGTPIETMAELENRNIDVDSIKAKIQALIK